MHRKDEKEVANGLFLFKVFSYGITRRKIINKQLATKTTHSAEGKHNELTCELLIRLTGVALGDRAFEVGGIFSEQDYG